MNTATTLRAVDLEKFLTSASAIVKALGYVSKTDAEKLNKTATAELAIEWADDNKPKEIMAITFDSSDKVTAQEVAKWMAEIDTSHLSNRDYMFNLAHVGVTKTVTDRTAGYAASAIGAFEREKAKGAQDKSSLDEFAAVYGNPGAKFRGITVLFTGKSQFDSRFGLCHKYQFEDAKGRKLVWMTSTELNTLNQGHAYNISATVKKYSTYKGSHSCEITRVGGLPGQ